MAGMNTGEYAGVPYEIYPYGYSIGEPVNEEHTFMYGDIMLLLPIEERTKRIKQKIRRTIKQHLCDPMHKKPLAKLIKCPGEAHENAYIDNCELCAPFWDIIPICPIHNSKLTTSLYCRTCKRFYRRENNDIKRGL